MTVHDHGDRAIPYRPAHAPADLVVSTVEPTVWALPYRPIETRKLIVYLTVYLGVS